MNLLNLLNEQLIERFDVIKHHLVLSRFCTKSVIMLLNQNRVLFSLKRKKMICPIILSVYLCEGVLRQISCSLVNAGQRYNRSLVGFKSI